ncbi:tetratricopeptide repeat protein [Paenibacillus sp. AR247]|uniref:tetratricopeptide repeat protein n=1 Tax=Paenibacillus sp. AR247 TaxID=1631599 RepID=UPI002156FEDA|nr:tetratricopeptide repeat protein [Paenibacillus sp. AR247]
MGKEAIPYYERALQLGLSGNDLERCLLGLGSTYRYWGQYEKAIATLRRGVQEFPDNRALRVFLAMALYNGQQYKESVELLITNLMESTTDEKLLYFKRGILAYTEDLDETAE